MSGVGEEEAASACVQDVCLVGVQGASPSESQLQQPVGNATPTLMRVTRLYTVGLPVSSPQSSDLDAVSCCNFVILSTSQQPRI